ncbi:uncharacterized protein WM294_002823 isoform 2-T10 [Sarcoramphus papa]
MSLSLYFLSPVQLRRGSDKAALVRTWHLARVNPPQREDVTGGYMTTLWFGVLVVVFFFFLTLKAQCGILEPELTQARWYASLNNMATCKWQRKGDTHSLGGVKQHVDKQSEKVLCRVPLKLDEHLRCHKR